MWLLNKCYSHYIYIQTECLYAGLQEEIYMRISEKMRKIFEKQYKHGDLQSYVRPLETVILFTYLGRFHITSDNDWMAVVASILTSQWKWARLSRILG